MIYDHIKNIGLYKGLTPAIDTALEYIAHEPLLCTPAGPELVKKVVLKVSVGK